MIDVHCVLCEEDSEFLHSKNIMQKKFGFKMPYISNGYLIGEILKNTEGPYKMNFKNEKIIYFKTR